MYRQADASRSRKQKMQEKKRKQSSYFIEEIDEENLMDELESGDTGIILEQA